MTASNLLSEDNKLKERFSGFVRKPFSQRELFNELADFLPKYSRPTISSQVDGSETPDNVSASFAPVSKELVTELRQLLVETWPAIRDQRGGQ